LGDSWRQLATKVLLFFAILVIALIVLDRLAGAFLPALPPKQVAHPPNYVERRTNIEFTYEFRTNSMGLRYHELPLAKQSDREFRVFVLGDSMTEGFGVEASDRFTDRLEAAFSATGRPVYFINGGLSGRGPLQYGRMLFTVGLRYHPDLALFVIHANDPDDVPYDANLDVYRHRDGTYGVREPTLLWPPGGIVTNVAYHLMPWIYARLQYRASQHDSSALTALNFETFIAERARRLNIPDADVEAWKARVGPKIMKAAADGQFNGAQLALGLFERDHWVNCLDLASDVGKARWSAMERVLDETATLCTDTHLTCAIAYSPTTVQYDATAGSLQRQLGITIRSAWLTEPSGLERRLQEWSAVHNIAYMSLTDEFRRVSRQHPGSLFFALDGHWNPAGNRLAAEALATWLRDSRLVPADRTTGGLREPESFPH
jgi:hypothetical protein